MNRITKKRAAIEIKMLLIKLSSSVDNNFRKLVHSILQGFRMSGSNLSSGSGWRFIFRHSFDFINSVFSDFEY